MPAVFSNYLKNIRHEKGLTQREAIELLVNYDEAFSKLDLTTFSRWEKQKTAPSLARKILLLRGLEGNTLKILDPLLEKPDQKQLNEILSSRNLDPYSLDKVKFKLTVYQSLLTEPKIEAKMKIFHLEYLQIPINLSEYFATSKVKLNVLTDDTGYMFGHALFGFCPIGNSLSELDIKALDASLNRDSTLPRGKNFILNVLSIYGATPYSRMVHIIQLLKLIRDNCNIKALLVTLHYHDAFSYFYNISASTQVLEMGEQVDSGGVKISGKHYKYARVLIRSEDILSCKTLLEYAVHSDAYLDDLLFEEV